MGWDAFGLPAENGRFPEQGPSRDLDPPEYRRDARPVEIDRADDRLEPGDRDPASPTYYKHEQAMFLDFLEHGLAYRRESWVNWDPVENTVLANEQVIDGRGWRSGAPVERRKLSQWFLKITEYADELLAALKTLDRWPDKVRTMQENWIGKSSGARLTFPLAGRNEHVEVYTTRPDTLFGASFLAISPDQSAGRRTGR